MTGKDSTIAVVGLGYVGQPLFEKLIEKKFTVFGFDTNDTVIKRLNLNLKKHIKKTQKARISKE